MIEFEESGLHFQLPDSNCFRIEKHPLVCKGYRSTQNLRACEFVTHLNGRFVFVEAKSSCPKGPSGNVGNVKLGNAELPPNWTIYDNYTTFLRHISKKFVDSYHILRAIYEGYHGEDEKKNLNLTVTGIKNSPIEFVLVINIPENSGNTIKESLAPLKDALTNEMRPFLKLWNISTASVKVMWPEQCNRYGFMNRN